MKNVKMTPADRLNIVAGSGGLSAGDIHVLVSGNAGMLCVAVNDITAGEVGPAVVKNTVISGIAADNGTGKTFAQGDKLYWDGSELTKTASGNTFAGRAAVAKAADDTTAELLLTAGD